MDAATQHMPQLQRQQDDMCVLVLLLCCADVMLSCLCVEKEMAALKEQSEQRHASTKVDILFVTMKPVNSNCG